MTSPTCSGGKQQEHSHEHQTKRSGHRRYRPAGRRGCARTAVQGTSRQSTDPQAGQRRHAATDIGRCRCRDWRPRRHGVGSEGGTWRQHHVSDGQQQRGWDQGRDPSGNSAAEAAKDAGVGHLVYSSVADTNKKTGVPHFESKYLVEKHIAGLGIPYTISAPASFMENIVAPWSIGALRQGATPSRCRPNASSSL